MAPSSVSNSQQQVEQVSGLAGSGGGNLELGELGQLTITNDNESAYDVSYQMLYFSCSHFWPLEKCGKLYSNLKGVGGYRGWQAVKC